MKSLAVYETVPYQLSLLLAEDNDEKNDAALRIKANWAKMELLERRRGAIGVSFLYDAIPWSRSCFVRESAFLVGARGVGALTTAFSERLRAIFSSPLSTRVVENGFNVYKRLSKYGRVARFNALLSGATEIFGLEGYDKVDVLDPGFAKHWSSPPHEGELLSNASFEVNSLTVDTNLNGMIKQKRGARVGHLAGFQVS